MFNLSNITALLYTKPVDMRKQIDGLVMLVAQVLQEDPQSEKLFVFRNKQSDKLKLLYWEKDGFWLLYRRLEKGRFCIPKLLSEKCNLSLTQMRWLLEGLDISKLTEKKSIKHRYFY